MRQVKVNDGQKLAKQYNAPFFECSAKTGENVKQAFHSLISVIKNWKEPTSKSNSSFGSRVFSSVKGFGFNRAKSESSRNFSNLPNSRTPGKTPITTSTSTQPTTSKDIKISAPTSVTKGHSVLASQDGNMIWAPDAFRFIKKIGSGSYGSVHIAEWKATGAKFAVKIMTPEPGE